ncbi:O-antigen ligase family protein [Aestuariivirga sp.]|uniref:O-antigen ligase family protein n=1 Tax=Aestuariivirga sp. TaxID=2650926 RepID=UPI00391B9134
MSAAGIAAPSPRRISLDGLQLAAVWLMMASSFFVTREPAPVDLIFSVAALAFVARGLAVTALAAPLILLLALYNFGGFLSYLPVRHEPETGLFVLVSCYVAVTAVFFCLYLQQDTERRFAVLKNGYIVGAVLGAAIAIGAYAGLEGFSAWVPQTWRAQGTFKDPNVLASYLVLPAILLMQDVIAGARRFLLLRLAGLGLLLACLFLAFSRGAWMNFAVSASLMASLTFLLATSPAMRMRILMLALSGFALLAAGLTALISIDGVGQMFADRATLLQTYDDGEFGRFGNQLNAIPLLLERPLGFGPLQYGAIFGLDLHNVYLNAFSAYGWLGGISYAALIAATLAVGFRSVLRSVPWRPQAIALFAVFAATALQGLQIDTDHWRHFYWILGLVWGLAAAPAAYAAGRSGRISASI